MKKRLFDLVYAPVGKRHLKTIESKYYSLIRETIAQQLQANPDIENRNRKPLKRPILGAAWEIRFGPNNRLRVLYKVDRDEHRVYILAIVEKDAERLRIGGEEIIL